MDYSSQNIASIYEALKEFKQSYGGKLTFPDKETLTATELFAILDPFVQDPNNNTTIRSAFFTVPNKHTPISSIIGSFYLMGSTWDEACFNALLKCDLVTLAKNRWVVGNIWTPYNKSETLIHYLEARDLHYMGEIFAHLIRNQGYLNHDMFRNQLPQLLNLLVICPSLKGLYEKIKTINAPDIKLLLQMAQKEAAVSTLIESNQEIIKSQNKEGLIDKILENDPAIALVLCKAALEQDDKGLPNNPLSEFFAIKRGYTEPKLNNGTRFIISGHIKTLEAQTASKKSEPGFFKTLNTHTQTATSAYTPG